jgi:nucleotide-binding universal stress UspA family protein
MVLKQKGMEGTNMYDKILIPLDGSALAEQVLPYVSPLAKALVASIELLRTIPPAGPELADLAPGGYPHQVARIQKTRPWTT